VPRLLTRVVFSVLAVLGTAWILCLPALAVSARHGVDGSTEPQITTTEPDLCLRNQIPWGPSAAVGINGELAVVGIGSVARIIDISNPDSPLFLSDIVLPAALSSVAFVGGYAVLTDLSWGFRVIDLADPRAPVEVASIEMPGCCHRTAVAGDSVIATLGREGLIVVDLSDPTHPTPGVHLQLGDRVNNVVVEGSRAFVVTTTWVRGRAFGGLTILDITEPSSPVQLGVLIADHDSSSVAVDGSHAFLSLWESGLMVIDISDATQPRSVAILDHWMRANDMAIRGPGLVIADGNQGVILVDISDPLTPFVTTAIAMDGWTYRIGLTDSHALVANQQSGLHVIDLDNAAGPIVVASIEAHPWIREVSIVGSRLYVRSDDLLRVFRVSHNGALDEIGQFDLSDYSVIRLIATVDHVYLIAGSPGGWYGPSLFIIDVGTPGNPSLVGQFDGFPATISGMDLLDDHVIVAGTHMRDDETYAARLWVVDVGDPTSPVEAAVLEFDGWYFDVAASGDHVYAGLHSDVGIDIQIIDLSEPDQPTLVGHFLADGWAPREFEIGNQALYILDHPDLRVLSLSNPVVPVEVGFIGGLGSAVLRGLRVDRNAVIAQNYLGLHYIDVRDPTQPTPVGYHALPAEFESFDVQNGVVYVAAAGSGVQVFGPCRSTATRTASSRTQP
jgi:hypothetical protein